MRPITTDMLHWLERILRGYMVYLADIPVSTRRGLLKRVLVYRDARTSRARLTRDARLICAGAAAARRAYIREWGR